LSDRERTMTTSDIAAGPSADEDAPVRRDDGGRHDGEGRPDSEATLQARAEPATTPLFSDEQSADFDRRWRDIQTSFVDEPRGAVEGADELVAELMQQLATGFAKTREQLERQWGQGDDVSTEDLRLALTRYRSFFHRLLST
jgi:hypothetical protein